MKQYPSVKVALNRLKAGTHEQQALNEHTVLTYMTIWEEETNKHRRHLFVYNVNRTGSRERIEVVEESVEGIERALKELETQLLLDV